MTKKAKNVHCIRSCALALMGALLILTWNSYPLRGMPYLLSILAVAGFATGMPWFIAGTVNKYTVWRMLFAIVEFFSGMLLYGFHGLPDIVYQTVVAGILMLYGFWFLIEALEVKRKYRKSLTMLVSAIETIIFGILILCSGFGYFETLTPTWIGIFYLFSATTTAITIKTI